MGKFFIGFLLVMVLFVIHMIVQSGSLVYALFVITGAILIVAAFLALPAITVMYIFNR